MGYDVNDVAEMILYGLDENDKVTSAEILKPTTGMDKKTVVHIQTDTGQEFFAEIIQA